MSLVASWCLIPQYSTIERWGHSIIITMAYAAYRPMSFTECFSRDLVMCRDNWMENMTVHFCEAGSYFVPKIFHCFIWAMQHWLTNHWCMTFCLNCSSVVRAKSLFIFQSRGTALDVLIGRRNKSILRIESGLSHCYFLFVWPTGDGFVNSILHFSTLWYRR